MFKTRSHTKELLDGDEPEKDLFVNLKELHTINKLLGGYKVTLSALKHLDLQNKTWVDIGSGGGDMLQQIKKYNQKQGIETNLVGVDLKAACIEYAQQHQDSDVTFIQDDYRNAPIHIKKIDYLHACLFTHHLSDEQIIELIRFALEHNITLIINDLQRHWLAYYSIKLLTTLFSNSYLVKNDAPLSVLRGFRKKEWTNYLIKAGAKQYTVQWKWAFRHLIIVHG